MREAAQQLAARGWAVIPLAGKVPAVRGGRGVLDATTDPDQIDAWWTEYPAANIGARVPDDLVVLDVDPRNGGLDSLRVLVREHGPIPATTTVRTGRGDGGRHYYLRRWGPGQLSARLLPRGIDLKTNTGYCVMPPSIHPDTGHAYVWWASGIIAPTPWWLRALLRPDPEPAPARPAPRTLHRRAGVSVIDTWSEAATWGGILGGVGWRVTRGDGESPGSHWCHPAATSACSASISGDQRLYVYSPNTPFLATEPGRPMGYSKFDAWACLHHGGDYSAAAAEISRTGVVA